MKYALQKIIRLNNKRGHKMKLIYFLTFIKIRVLWQLIMI